MPILFEENAGRVFAVPDRSAQGSISLGNIEGPLGPITYFLQNSIITRIGYSAAGNYQFLHTIGNDVYLYVFGDRMGTVELHGMSFADQCPSSFGEAHGFEKMIVWYQLSRIASYREPVTVSIGRNTTFKGFITGMSGDVQDTLRRTINWRISVAILPDVQFR